MEQFLSFDSNRQHLRIFDFNGELKELPEDFFRQYPDLKSLDVHALDLAALPSSVNTLKQLEILNIDYTKLKQLPALAHLKELHITNNNLIDFDKEGGKLIGLTALTLGGYRGNTLPQKLVLLQSLETLKLTNSKKNSNTWPEILELIKALPQLKFADIDMPQDKGDVFFTEEGIAILDRLEKISGRYFDFFFPNRIPLVIGLTKKVSFQRALQHVLPEFRHLTASKNYSPLQLKLLFGLFTKSTSTFSELLPNKLKDALHEKITLRLLEKPKGESMQSINKKLGKYGIKTSSTADDENTIVVIGNNSSFEEVIKFVDNNRDIITIDQLNEVLINEGEHWLLQDDNKEINEPLLRLLSSNQPENYKVAFQIIETGGANKTIQSMLAAVMMAHPDKEIYKSAEKLYDKYGSQSFKLHAKGVKASLRKGGNVKHKIDAIVAHPDIDAMMFRLMCLCISGIYVFEMKGYKDLKLPEEIVYFSHIQKVYIENCEGFHITEAIDLLKEMPACKVLKLSGCHIPIPASISSLSQLETLEIAYNAPTDISALQSLTSLKVLNVEGIKIKEWEWLLSLNKLEILNINNNELQTLPDSLFSLRQLNRLEAKQNKITVVQERLNELVSLRYLDLSNNQIKDFPYFLSVLQLQSLLLRSNKISLIDTAISFPSLRELNLSRNLLTELQFKHPLSLGILDISYNKISKLDDSLFTALLRSFYANNNEITFLPKAILNSSNYHYFWLQNNFITELPDFFAHAIISNADFSNNKIASIHPDFDKYGAQNYGRLYWKMEKNLLPAMKIGGMYIH
ncbi:Leucine rich repeat-containing protein [Chitinophaga sp. YR573]|uniref:leucine-rich repeat domain-containing protein n=1 Tax=Chitinophaga sp. YR573 TaxID=1881040 RepID=UPI0008B58F15|nr:leucine-rich repeat domain-containing protein [Chitinophaga sp. YR573]SEW29636.1 Leucine rich repeat-containing protein [Chitinophaga sp. YR573]